MKPTILTSLFFTMMLTGTHAIAQETTLESRIQHIEDRLALKALIDEFSNLADVKDVDAQVLLFTEDAVVESYRGAERSSLLEGREQIGEVFGGFLANFETVYHTNGQQTVEIDGDNATGIAYCLVVLIANNNGERTKTTMGVRYNDTYVRENGNWLIKKRQSYFDWTEVTSLN
jgi:ketosteroid isomerase-like protein